MRTKPATRAALVALASTLLLMLSLAHPASAATRSWVRPVDYPYPGNWHCTERLIPESAPRGSVDVCLIHGNNGTQPTFRGVMIVWNLSSGGFQMSAAKINLWAKPAPSVLVQEDGCLDSGLSAGFEAACYGTAVTRSQVCAAKPGATSVHAVGAINIPALSSDRITVTSKSRAIVC
ncbi:hypothetical protein YIM_22590 [Amycolatopsis sp. YIM 10]|nr:hypothetical protein YIM_22590 [Amycolatopsis sp. YIM 10]